MKRERRYRFLLLLKTDCYEGETVGYETQFLENFDSRKYPYGWKNTGFDADGWEKPVPAVWADYTLTKQPTEMLSYMEYQLGTIKLHAGNEHPLEPTKLHSDAVQPLEPAKLEHKCADHNGHIHQITPSVIRQDPDGSMLLDAGEEIIRHDPAHRGGERRRSGEVVLRGGTGREGQCAL